jgi:hypothetical protein
MSLVDSRLSGGVAYEVKRFYYRLGYGLHTLLAYSLRQDMIICGSIGDVGAMLETLERVFKTYK